MEEEKKEYFVKLDMGDTTAHLKPLPQMEEETQFENRQKFVDDMFASARAKEVQEYFGKEGTEYNFTSGEKIVILKSDDDVSIQSTQPQSYEINFSIDYEKAAKATSIAFAEYCGNSGYDFMGDAIWFHFENTDDVITSDQLFDKFIAQYKP